MAELAGPGYLVKASLAPPGTQRRLLLAAMLLGAALSPHNGGLGPLALPPIIACLIILWRLGRSLRDEGPSGPAMTPEIWLWLLGVPAILNVFRTPGEALLPGTSFLPHIALALFLFGVGISGVRRGDRASLAIAASLAYLFAGVYLLRHAPSPRIDVFIIQQEGSAALLSGHDPYAALFRNPYSPLESIQFFGRALSALDHYPYPPLSLLVTAASYALFGDVRVVFLLLHVATGLFLFALGRRRGLGLGLICLHLLHPRGFLVIEQSWTEPLLVACAALWIYGRSQPQKPTTLAAIWEGVRLSLVLSAKQYAVLLLPLCLLPQFAPAWLRPRRFLAVGVAVISAVALCVPFLLWHPQDLIEDVFWFQIRQPFRADSLSLGALIYLASWQKVPGWLAFVGALAPLYWLRKRLLDDSAGLLIAAIFSLLGFFLSAKQAFGNYYYFVGVLMLLSAALVREEAAPAGEGSPAAVAQ